MEAHLGPGYSVWVLYCDTSDYALGQLQSLPEIYVTNGVGHGRMGRSFRGRSAESLAGCLNSTLTVCIHISLSVLFSSHIRYCNRYYEQIPR